MKRKLKTIIVLGKFINIIIFFSYLYYIILKNDIIYNIIKKVDWYLYQSSREPKVVNNYFVGTIGKLVELIDFKYIKG